VYYALKRTYRLLCSCTTEEDLLKLFFLVEYPNSGHIKPTAEGTINHLLRSKIVLHLYQYFYRPALRGSVTFEVISMSLRHD